MKVWTLSIPWRGQRFGLVLLPNGFFFVGFFALALALGGCNVAARLANGAVAEPNGEVVEPNGEVIEPSGAIVEPNGEVIQPASGQTQAEIIAIENDMCLVRARHFKGLVRVPCDQIAREPAP